MALLTVYQAAKDAQIAVLELRKWLRPGNKEKLTQRMEELVGIFSAGGDGEMRADDVDIQAWVRKWNFPKEEKRKKGEYKHIVLYDGKGLLLFGGSIDCGVGPTKEKCASGKLYERRCRFLVTDHADGAKFCMLFSRSLDLLKRLPVCLSSEALR